MPKLGVEFTTSETPGSGGTSQGPGTLFLVGAAGYGPEEPVLIRSLNEAVTYYGPREAENAKLYDALNTFFVMGGSQAWVNRIHGAGSPVAALLELETTGTAKTLVVTAKYKGTYGNGYKIAIVEGTGKTKLVVYNESSEVLVESPEYAKASELLAWGEEKAHQTYVTVTAGSGYSSGKAELVKKLAATKLATGANPTNNESTTNSTIEGFPKTLGPGQIVVAATEGVKIGVHTAMGEHALKNNRYALCDIEGSDAVISAATLISNKGTPATGIAGYMAFFSTFVKVQGITLGTERTVGFSAIAAGLFAKVSNTGTDNRAPAGPRWPLSSFVISLVNTYNEATMEEINNANINCVAERRGVFCLYGDVSALAQSKDLIFWQYSAGRERMRLVWEGETILERSQFITLDGRHLKRAQMQGELQGMIANQWRAESLYGNTATEAGIVVVGEPVNTPALEQSGQLNCELQVRLSPVVQGLTGVLVSVPITESV